MTEPLTLAQFETLADAYGGVVARWPDRHRDAAMRMAAQPAAAAILARASALDATLDAWVVAAPGEALRAGVLAAAPASGRSVVRRARLWWSGVGVAAALAGAAAGTAAVALVAPIDAASVVSTTFGDVGARES